MEQTPAEEMSNHVAFSLLALREGVEMRDDAVCNAGNATEAANKVNALARFMRREIDACLKKVEEFDKLDREVRGAISKAGRSGKPN
jgi:hypothetical protein